MVRPLPRGFRAFTLQFPTNPLASPGGKPEAQDQGDPASTLLREADEEAAARLGTPLLLGHVTDPAKSRAYLRYAAALKDIGPARPDPAYTRILATPEQATALFDWGGAANGQLAAVHRARQRLGIPRAAPQSVTELPDSTAWYGLGEHRYSGWR